MWPACPNATAGSPPTSVETTEARADVSQQAVRVAAGSAGRAHAAGVRSVSSACALPWEGRRILAVEQRATREAWAASVPPSVTMAAARANSGVHAGAVAFATSTSPSRNSPESRGLCTMRTGPVARPADAGCPTITPSPHDPHIAPVRDLPHAAQQSTSRSDTCRFSCPRSTLHDSRSTCWWAHWPVRVRHPRRRRHRQRHAAPALRAAGDRRRLRWNRHSSRRTHHRSAIRSSWWFHRADDATGTSNRGTSPTGRGPQEPAR